MIKLLLAIVGVAALSFSNAAAQCSGSGGCGGKKGDKKEDTKESMTVVIDV